MNLTAALLSALLLMVVPGVAAESPRVAASLEKARTDAQGQRFEEALRGVDSALALEPGNAGARLLRARILSWKGDYAAAERELNALHAEDPSNPDLRLARGYLFYYQGRNADAAADFRAVLAARPGDAEAGEGLRNAQKAQADARAAKAAAKPWRADAGGEYSLFTRRDQPAWGQAYAQLGRAFDDSRAFAYARGEYYRQFELNDYSLEAGVSRRFTPRAYAGLAAGHTFAADFKPVWRVSADAGFQAYREAAPTRSGPFSKPVSAWLLASGWYDAYETVKVLRTSPGVRVESGDWALTGRLSRVDERLGRDDNNAVYGWLARLDGPLPVAGRSALFQLGYADAPETVAGSTIATRTVFGGLNVPLGADLSANLGYTRDDREGAYVRHAFHAGLTRRF